jgi:hypothetical protein
MKTKKETGRLTEKQTEPIARATVSVGRLLFDAIYGTPKPESVLGAKKFRQFRKQSGRNMIQFGSGLGVNVEMRSAHRRRCPACATLSIVHRKGRGTLACVGLQSTPRGGN